ncbi:MULTISPECIES: DsrE family protein [Thioclava]|uniref:DsrE family protein n=1 Tax=Thioclava TaxID=285107 RepID=UPI000C5ACF08|nr:MULTISPECIES: DsrE family protein [Thioclava]MAQ37585.1 sulfur reduction protein DsrE [Thioclava sp.]
MQRAPRFVLPAALALALGSGAAFAASSSNDGLKTEWINPVVKDYGKMHPVPDGALSPDPNKDWKIVFDVGMGETMDGGVNAALWHVARAVNVYGNAGVDKEHRKFAVVLHGAATPLALSPEAYKDKFGKDDPDTKLKQELADAGVTLYVCGQALADHGFTEDQVGPNVDVALSALAAVPVLESQGYQLFPM